MQRIAHRILPILHKRQEQIAEQALQILAKYQTTQRTQQTISRQQGTKTKIIHTSQVRISVDSCYPFHVLKAILKNV